LRGTARYAVLSPRMPCARRLRSANETAENWRSLDEVPELGALLVSNSTVPPPGADLPSAPASLYPRFDRASLNIERAEKVGRLVLWLVLSVTIVLVSLGKFESLQKSVSDKTLRIPFESFGNGLTSLNVENATGQLWFTNLSPRSGQVCVVGEAANAATHAVTLSLPACAEVAPYASAVHVTLLFPAHQLADDCKTGGCNFRVRDAGGPKN
jgi:hypothetical protein